MNETLSVVLQTAASFSFLLMMLGMIISAATDGDSGLESVAIGGAGLVIVGLIAFGTWLASL